MTRRALAGAVLAVVAAAGTGAPVFAALSGNKAAFVFETGQGLNRRTEGRLDTWNLKALRFTPDSRTMKALTIEYKSITSLEYGRAPGRRPGSLETPAPFVDKTHYLTILYTEPELTKEEKEQEDEADRKARLDPEQEKARQKAKEAQQAKDKKKGKEKKPDSIAVFELGDATLRPTLRILEARSGKRIRYQDAEARRSAR